MSSPTLNHVDAHGELSGGEPLQDGDVNHKQDRDSKPHATARARWGKLKSTMNAVQHMQSKRKVLDRGDSFLRKFSTRHQAGDKITSQLQGVHRRARYNNSQGKWAAFVIHPAGGPMFHWLGFVTLSVLYNLWTCIAREAFREIQDGHRVVWILLDAACDTVYLLDIVAQFRTGYLQQGLMVYDSMKLCRNYMKNKCFIVDLVCLLPLDLLQFYTGTHAMLRFPRFLKLYRGMRFMHIYESRTAYPNLLRVLSLSHILFLGAHWFAAFYYLISEAEGFRGDWSYPEPMGQYAAVTRKYLASLYWSTLTLTTIGDLPPPNTDWEYVFVIVSYLIGVFIFATIVGQVGNVITNRNASRQEFERLLDGAKFYMQTHNIPPELQKRVQRWYDYVWTRGRLNCNDINSLGLLPDKLKTELALHVNLGTLKKVAIFQKCRPEFLHDLMLKMRAFIFTPGDLICRRGEVAREMFIIADGVVEIIGEGAAVLTQMSTGDFFGEIGILNLDGGINRRTADVRSVGYSELFVLSREDVLDALKDHPDAESIIREYGQRRLRETEEHRKTVLSAPSSPDPTPAVWTSFRSSLTKQNKTDTSNHALHVPQQSSRVLQKLPQMSPKLKKVFSLKSRKHSSKKHTKRRKSSYDQHVSLELEALQNKNRDNDVDNLKPGDGMCRQSRRRSTRSDLAMTFPMSNLIAIPERESGVDTDQSGYESSNQNSPVGNKAGKEGYNLADVVLSLLKRKKEKRPEYCRVSSNDDDSEKVSQLNVESTNDQTGDESSKCDSENNSDRDDNQVDPDKIKLPVLESGKDRAGAGRIDNSTDSTRQLADQSRFDSDSDSCTDNEEEDLKVPVGQQRRSSFPMIVLTPDTNSPSTSDSDDHCDIARLASIRSSPTRRSSPSILGVPPKFPRRKGRRISCPPPLDLPIEVPPLSRFRGLTTVRHDVNADLDTFTDAVERRLLSLEHSYRATVRKLDETANEQGKLMTSILRQVTALSKTMTPPAPPAPGQPSDSADTSCRPIQV